MSFDMQKIIHGDCLDEMQKMESNTIDFIVTDPPYGLSFMSKKWDCEVPQLVYWKECLRICKPGSMLAAFGGTRTYHRLTCAIEDSGWEIRDCIMWLYGSGFPKSHNKFGLDGYGTALKPAWEPIIIAMKPLDGTYKDNVEKWEVGGINIDSCRIPVSGKKGGPSESSSGKINCLNTYNKKYRVSTDHTKGRWPANLILDEEAAKMLDTKSGITVSSDHIRKNSYPKENIYDIGFNSISLKGIKDSGGASRFFYCAKASSRERNEGLEGMPILRKKVSVPEDPGKGEYGQLEDGKQLSSAMQNFHPTVKPISLMKYIIKLLAPPGNPVLLDPFAGSGSTLCAAAELGINAIGIERELEYCNIGNARVKNHLSKNIQIEMNFEDNI